MLTPLTANFGQTPSRDRHVQISPKRHSILFDSAKHNDDDNGGDNDMFKISVDGRIASSIALRRPLSFVPDSRLHTHRSDRHTRVNKKS